MLVLLRLLASPVTKIVLSAFGVIAVVGYLRYDAAQDARRATELEYRKAAAEQIGQEITRQRQAAQRAIGAAEHRAEKMKAERDALAEKVDQVVARLRAAPENACRLGPDLTRELQSIR